MQGINVAAALQAAGLTTTSFYDDGFHLLGHGTLSTSHHAYADGKPLDYPEFAARYGLPAAGVALSQKDTEAEIESVFGQAVLAASSAGGLATIGLEAAAGIPSQEDIDDLRYCLRPEQVQALLKTFGPESHKGGADAGPLPPVHPVDKDALLKDYSAPWWQKLAGGLDPGGPHPVYPGVGAALAIFLPDLKARFGSDPFLGMMFPGSWVAQHGEALIALDRGTGAPGQATSPAAAPPSLPTRYHAYANPTAWQGFLTDASGKTVAYVTTEGEILPAPPAA